MPIGETLAKLAKLAGGGGRPLDSREIEELRLWGNQTQMRNAFVAENTTPGNQLNINFPFAQIFSVVLATDTAERTVRIPGGYKHLVVISAGKTDSAYRGDILAGQFNGDTGNNYSLQILYGYGSNTTSVASTNPRVEIATFAGGLANASEANGSVAFVPHYRGSWWKSVYLLGGASTNSIDTNPSVGMQASFWKNTSPIESVKFFPAFGTVIKAGSAISVYGVL